MDFTTLYKLATEIRTETADAQNTAERVGSLFYSIVGAIDTLAASRASSTTDGLMSQATYNTLVTQTQKISEVDAKVNKLAASRASATTDGLMSKETYNTLVTQTQKISEVDAKVNKLAASRASATTDGLMSKATYNTLATQTQKISEIEAHLPAAQTSVAGTDKSYAYSLGNHEDTKTLISSKFWIYQHTDGNMFFRVKHWGAANDKKETDYSQVMIPNAWTGANGLLRRDVYSRLDSFALREENSTTTEVVIVTPIFTTGGTRTFSISRATSAKAGAMSAEDKTKLDRLATTLASSTTDGLMSQATYNTLVTQTKKISELDENVNKLIARIEALEKK